MSAAFKFTLVMSIACLSACTPSKKDSAKAPAKPNADSSTPGSGLPPANPLGPTDPNFVSQAINLGTPDSICPPYVFQQNLIQTMLDPTQLPAMEGLPRDLKTINPDLAPYGFGCYGACGPSCKATCRDIAPVEKIYRIKAADGTMVTRLCSYKRIECLSDLRCRKHDECYRQVDLQQFAKTHDTSKPPSTLGTTGYRVCDVKGPFLDEASKIQRWFSVTDPSQLTPQERNLCFASYIVGNVQTGLGDCWDGTTTKYADLAGENTLSPSDPRAQNAVSYP